MADLVMGALDNLVPNLYELLKEEYNLQTGVKERISSLTKELEHAHATLRKVAEVPWDQLDERVQLWTRDLREASYDMEDVLDTFLVRVQGSESTEEEQSLLKYHLKKVTNLFKKNMARRKISGDVKDIMTHLQEVTDRCRRYKVDDIVARPATSTIDPRLHAMYTQVNKLVGIDKSSSELKSKLQLDDMSNTKMKTVSIVGIGGLGKTTLAKAVYDNLRGDFNCRAFVPVGRNPDLQKVLQMILIALDKERYEKFNFAVLQHITQFINELRDFLRDNKRYFIVIDDIWEKKTWEILKLAIPDDGSCEGRIIVTTRKWEVANNADEVYKLPPLPYDNSRKLFYKRIYSDEINHIDYQPDEISEEILRKCAGIPLAIITMASLLVNKPMERWLEVHKSVGFGCKDNENAENIMNKILSFSYYDLPSHLRACLLYISAFPEDSVIDKVSLIWMWVAEGFVKKREGEGLFETGEGFFNDLINRSMIQGVESDDCDDDDNIIIGCRVHDMVLDFIRSMSLEENFFTVFDNNDYGRVVRSNVVRRLAHHGKTMVLSNEANMSKLRSLIVPEYGIDTWASISSFKLLRVLNIEYSRIMDDSSPRVEHLGQLLHLRFLRISGMCIKKIPKEIGALKMLQTLDLFDSYILELPSSSSLPTQLVCLRIAFHYETRDDELFSVGRLTSLEELSIEFICSADSEEAYEGARQFLKELVKELGSLTELRVLDTWIHLEDEERESDLVESLRHLHKVQHLRIHNKRFPSLDRRPEKEFDLSGDLQTFVLSGHQLWKLPSCIDPLWHRKLSHLDLALKYMDEQELKTLGRLPELCFLGLDLQRSSPTIRNISDSNVCYFPKLRCLRLRSSLARFIANNGDDGKKTVSFHIWDGEVDDNITKPPSDSDAELQGDHEFSSVFQEEKSRGPVGDKSDEELQLLSISDDVQHGIAVSSVSVKETKESSISTKFMPRLQVLEFHVRGLPVRDPRYYNNLGFEFLSSLQEISVDILKPEGTSSVQVEEVKTALRSVAEVHPNHPKLRVW